MLKKWPMLAKVSKPYDEKTKLLTLELGDKGDVYIVSSKDYDFIQSKVTSLLGALETLKVVNKSDYFMRIGAERVLRAMALKEYGSWNPAQIKTFIDNNMPLFDKVEEKDAAQDIA